MQLEMTQAEYARYRGVSRQAVNKEVRAGKLPLTPSGKIDVAAADRLRGEIRERIDLPRTGELPLEDGSAPGSSTGKLTEAKADRESYLARIAQLDYEERIGRLLPVEDVTRAMERCAESLVRDIERLPALADDLASAFRARGVPGLRAALKEKAREIRETIAANMRATADAQEDDLEEQPA